MIHKLLFKKNVVTVEGATKQIGTALKETLISEGYSEQKYL